MKTTGLTRTALAVLVVMAMCGSVSSGWSTPVPVDEVNTAYSDSVSFLSFDGLTLYFSRGNTDTFYYGRIYKATRAEPYGPFTTVQNISELNYSGGHVGSPWVSLDNLRMYYYRTEPGSLHRLKVSERAAVTNPWPVGSNISELNSLGNLHGPSLTQNELIIVFVGEAIPGSVGGYDIYIASRPDRYSPFGNVRNLAEINTTASDGSPFISSDGLMLYFSSDRNGSSQIFRASRGSLSEPFENVEHLSFFDIPGGYSGSPCPSYDGTAFYFVSALTGQPGDIYVSYSTPDTGPVAHWKFDEGTGSVAYDSAGTNDGTIYGAAWTTGIIDGALDFDGDDFVRIPDSEVFNFGTGDFSISAWFKTNDTSVHAGGPYIVNFRQNDNDPHIEIYILTESGKIGTHIVPDYERIEYGGNVTDGQWHNVVVTLINGQSNGYKLYLDGGEKGNGTCSPTLSNWDTLNIGCRGEYVGFFIGLIDDVRVYDRALSAAEVQELYTPVDTGLVAHWKFDEGMGSVAYDSAGSNDGTIYGAAWASGVIDGALDFDGVDDYVEVPYDSVYQLPVFTVSAWVYMASSDLSGDILTRGEDVTSDHAALIFKISDWGGFVLTYEDSSDQSHDFPTNYRPASKTWTHLAASRAQDGEIRIYANGILIDQWDSSATPTDNCYQNILIGAYWYNPSGAPYVIGFFPGSIDDVRIYDRALSTVEIEELYNSVPLPPVAKTYYVDGVNGSDLNDGESRETAFATIQKGIDTATDGNSVLVYPAVYDEALLINNKAIKLQGVATSAGIPIIQKAGDYAVSYYVVEGPDSLLKNFVIRGSDLGILIVGGAPTISNVTIVDNVFGIAGYADAQPDISNCIFWNNADGDLFGDPVPLEARYSCIEEGGEGEGNITIEPGFVDTNSSDYHLLSERGRHWPAHDVWVLDKVTSPCVDGGDPAVEPSNEPMPNGGRINMGAYGDTAYASMSEWPLKYDGNFDGIVNMLDLAGLAQEWLQGEVLPFPPPPPPPTLPGQASNPNPADGATGVSRTTDLSWIAGKNTVSHDVYFGETNPPGFQGNVMSPMFGSGSLNYETTYYWRIDEVNSSGITEGEVWSFTTVSSLPPIPPPT